jgi:hypothetical protein
VIWGTAFAFPTVDADDRAALAAYLDGGGSLFITGQDIGWDLNDQGGAALTWYHDYLHANYIADDTNDLTLTGVAGDPIGDGLSLNIGGGDGANNQDYPSDIDPRDGLASTVLQYDASRNGGIKADTGVYRVVYFSFGFEAVNNATDRALVMQRIIDWLAPGGTDVAAGDLPSPVTLLGNAPNPFNPRTEIVYRLAAPARVELAVYDLLGHRLREFEAVAQAAGEHRAVWDGRDDRGRDLPSGVYVARIMAGGEAAATKMVLAR